MANYDLTTDEQKIVTAMQISEARYCVERAARYRGTGVTAPFCKVDGSRARAKVSLAMQQVRLWSRDQEACHLRVAGDHLAAAAQEIARYFVTEGDVAVCRSLGKDLAGVGLAQFALAKAARFNTLNGKPLQIAPQRISYNSWRTKMGEASEIRPEDLDAGGWAKLAIKDIEQFLADPEHLESVQFLVNALGSLNNALTVAGASHRSAGGWE